MVRTFFHEIRYLLITGDTNQKSVPFTVRMREIICILFISFLIAMILIIVVRAFLFTAGIEFPTNHTQIAVSHNGLLYSLIAYLLYGPIIEELGFRLGLRFTRINFSLMTSCFIYFILIIFPFSQYHESINSFIVSITIASILGLIIFFSLKYLGKGNDYLANFWLKNKQPIFYFSIFLFSCVHLLNFELNFKTLLIMPLVTLPQTMSGVIFGYVRLKHGIFYSILLHSLVNLVAFTPTFLDFVK